MAGPYRPVLKFSRLVQDCWEILRDGRYPFFPFGGRSRPSRNVYVFPRFDVGYPWDIWEEAISPTLSSLRGSPPPYVGGWNNPQARNTLEAALRAALEDSRFALRVDFRP